MRRPCSGILDISALSQGDIPGITSALGTAFAEAASVCLHHVGHGIKSEITLHHNLDDREVPCEYTLQTLDVTHQMQRAYADLQEATEYGATGIALLLIREVTDYTVIQRSYKGTGFDYWLGQPYEPFERQARMEISGILSNVGEIERRVSTKRQQVQQSFQGLPAYIVVVEFNRLIARLEQIRGQNHHE